MCDCIKTNGEAAVAHATKQLAGKREVATSASLRNAGIRKVGNKLVIAPYDEYEISTYPLRRDGTRTGKVKVEALPFVHSYCPHCGEKYPIE